MKSAGSRVNQDEALKVSLSVFGRSVVAKNALTWPLIGRGKLVVLIMVTFEIFSMFGLTTDSSIAGETESALSLAMVDVGKEKMRLKNNKGNINFLMISILLQLWL